VPTTNKEKSTKSDKIDSRKQSRELENGSLVGIYIPDEFPQQLRSLCRLRFRVVQNQTRIKNRIKGHLYTYGIEIPSNTEMPHWSGNFIKWLESIEFSHDPGNEYLQFCLEEHKQHRQRLVEITRLLRVHCKEDGIRDKIKLLRSVPGIGFISAVTFYTEIIDIDRFKTLDRLASFVGLVPCVKSSGESKYDLGLSKRRNPYLRHLIIEAAWIAVRKDPALTLYFCNLTKRMKKQDAIIRVARKLLNRIRFVWKNQKPYVCLVSK